MIDLDVVHNIFLNKKNLKYIRRCGKTYATLFELLGAIELGDKNIFYVIKYYGSIDLVIDMFIDIIKEIRKEYSISRISKKKINILNSYITFVSEYEVEQKLKGIGDYTIVEMEL